MSYILDALKKSEQERNLGKTPDISSNHEVLHRGIDYRNWLLIAVTLVVVILLSGAGFFYIYLASQEQKVAQEKLVLEKKLHEAKVNELQMLKRQIQDERRIQPINEVQDSDVEENNDYVSRNDSIDNEVDANGLEIIRPSQERREQLQQQIQQDALKNESLKQEYEGLFEDENIDESAIDEDKDVAESEIEPEVDEPVWEDYPSIAELDNSIQHALPDLRVTTHIFSSASRNRKVMINEKMLLEGESISENLIIEYIMEDGVVLKFNDVSFRMKVLEEWKAR